MIKIWIQRKSKLDEKFSFSISQYILDSFFSDLFTYLKDIDDIIISFEKIEEE